MKYGGSFPSSNWSTWYSLACFCLFYNQNFAITNTLILYFALCTLILHSIHCRERYFTIKIGNDHYICPNKSPEPTWCSSCLQGTECRSQRSYCERSDPSSWAWGAGSSVRTAWSWALSPWHSHCAASVSPPSPMISGSDLQYDQDGWVFNAVTSY